MKILDFVKNIIRKTPLRVIEKEIWKIKLNRFYSKLIKKGWLVFDIGADMGEMSDVFLRLGAKVVCIEPNPERVKYLISKYRTNENIKVVNCGGGKEKEC